MQPRQRLWVAVIVASMIAVSTVLLGILVVEWETHPLAQTMRSHIWMASPFIIGPLLFLLIFYVLLRRQRRLVSESEITIGKIVGVRTGRRGVRIATYEFKDRSGRMITASCPDNTRLFAAGMSVPVFFAFENPETNQIALCGTPYEIVSPASPG